MLARYPVGARVTVFFDPDDPATAVLEPGPQLAVPIGLGISSIILFAFAWLPHRRR